MKIKMINLEDFFDDKYRYVCKGGIGATGVITEKQMVTRFNSKKDVNGKIIGGKGIGSHFETEGNILSEIFGFDNDLFLGSGYNPHIYNSLSKEYRNVLGEIVVVKYINNETGNYILIYLPLQQETITENQFEALKYISLCVDEVAHKVSKPIQIFTTDRHKRVREINSMHYTIIPFLEGFIDDTYKQSLEDKKIIAEEELSLKNKVLK